MQNQTHTLGGGGGGVVCQAPLWEEKCKVRERRWHAVEARERMRKKDGDGGDDDGGQYPTYQKRPPLTGQW